MASVTCPTSQLLGSSLRNVAQRVQRLPKRVGVVIYHIRLHACMDAGAVKARKAVGQLQRGAAAGRRKGQVHLLVVGKCRAIVTGRAYQHTTTLGGTAGITQMQDMKRRSGPSSSPLQRDGVASGDCSRITR